MWLQILLAAAFAAPSPQASLPAASLDAAPVAGRRDDVLRPSGPHEANLDAEALKGAVALVRAAVDADQLRGAVVLVARNGQIALHEAYGWRDADGVLPMERDTLFRLASNTKPVIAMAVLQLVEAGTVSLDDPIGRHLPEFIDGPSGKILVRHLLSHTSGLRIQPIFLTPLLPKTSLRQEVNRFAAVGPEFEPGTTYSYSNPGYNVLGALVEVASGASLSDYLREHIYEPLAMRRTCNHESVADRARMSSVFVKLKSGAWRVRWRATDEPDYPFVRASGGMIAPALEYAAFLQAMLQGGVYGGKRVLSEALVQAAFEPHSKLCFSAEEQAKRATYYGFGWSVRDDGIVAHSGSDGTFAWVDPARGIVGIVFTQSDTEQNPRAAFLDAVGAAADAWDREHRAPAAGAGRR
jgi:CubicO group peptidase (beta-lactamase class C family)